MSMAPREAKCSMVPATRAGHEMLGQRVSASPSGRTRVWPHTGHSVGNTHSGRPSGRSASTGPTISGMTSPALRTMTMSPGRTSLALTWSWLCRVATPTVEPPTKTGSSWPNGVARPVRPTDTVDVEELRGALLGRELEGDGPPGRLRGEAQLALQGEVVDLEHHAVDLVGEVVAVLLPVHAVGEGVLQPVEHLDLGVHREAHRRQELEVLVVVHEGGAARRPRRAGSSRTPARATPVMAASFWRSDPAAVLRGLA